VEGTYEEKVQSDLRKERYALVRSLRDLTRDPVLADNDSDWEGKAVERLLQFEQALYEYHKHGITPQKNDVWSFWNSVFYCGTIYTTIGESECTTRFCVRYFSCDYIATSRAPPPPAAAPTGFPPASHGPQRLLPTLSLYRALKRLFLQKPLLRTSWYKTTFAPFRNRWYRVSIYKFSYMFLCHWLQSLSYAAPITTVRCNSPPATYPRLTELSPPDIHLEDGNCALCRNVHSYSAFEAAHTLRLQSRNELQQRELEAKP
jgi:hypothetical protein